MKITRLALDEKGKPRISVFTRGNSFYARYRIQNKRISGGKLYVTETLKTANETEAHQRAYERLLEIRLAEKKGQSLTRNTTADAIDDFINEYEDALRRGMAGSSPNVLRQYKKTICRYWKDFIGNKPLADVSLIDMESYEGWRSAYWQNWIADQKLQKKGSRPVRFKPDGTVRLPSNARLRASTRTVQWEINSFKAFLAWAKRKGLYSGDAILFSFKKTSVSRRSSFTSSEYTRITGVMRRKSWLEVGKHQNDRRLSRYRKMLRAYVLFLANTGLRVGEARNLRWKDIIFQQNSNGERICRIWVAQAQSKVKKRREVIAMPKAAEVINDLRSSRRANNDFDRDDDPIWCDEKGRIIQDFREGFNNLIAAAKAEFDPDGKKYTIYCLRHFYITERLREGVPVYEVASNCGTSVDMIERYYSDARAPDFTDRLSNSRYRKVIHAEQPLS
jgi:integrase